VSPFPPFPHRSTGTWELRVFSHGALASRPKQLPVASRAG
jgi:hypothetical protein